MDIAITILVIGIIGTIGSLSAALLGRLRSVQKFCDGLPQSQLRKEYAEISRQLRREAAEKAAKEAQWEAEMMELWRA